MTLLERQIEAVGGLSAGLVTTLVTHPLDMIKVRLQLLQAPGSHRFSALRTVLKDINTSARHDPRWYRYWAAYYRGIGPNLVGNVAAWSLYFTLYAEFKRLIHSNDTVTYFGLSALAGTTTSLVTNPIWVLKTRILSSSRAEASAYKSLGDGIRQIYSNEGVLTFWKGTVPGLFSVFQASLQFTFYDHMKSMLGPDLSTLEYLYASATSKILSMAIMYPSQVIKSRLQSYNPSKERRTVSLVTRQVWNADGLRGFYRGLGANVLRVVPATCVTFLTYETVKTRLSR